MNNTEVIEVKVSGGTIRASKASDPDYPGVWVEFISDKDLQENELSRPSVLFEQTPDGEVRALIWADRQNEDFSDEISFADK